MCEREDRSSAMQFAFARRKQTSVAFFRMHFAKVSSLPFETVLTSMGVTPSSARLSVCRPRVRCVNMDWSRATRRPHEMHVTLSRFPKAPETYCYCMIFARPDKYVCFAFNLNQIQEHPGLEPSVDFSVECKAHELSLWRKNSL